MITAIAPIVGSLGLALWIGTKESLYPSRSPRTAGAMLAGANLHQPRLGGRCIGDGRTAAIVAREEQKLRWGRGWVAAFEHARAVFAVMHIRIADDPMSHPPLLTLQKLRRRGRRRRTLRSSARTNGTRSPTGRHSWTMRISRRTTSSRCWLHCSAMRGHRGRKVAMSGGWRSKTRASADGRASFTADARAAVAD